MARIINTFVLMLWILAVTPFAGLAEDDFAVDQITVITETGHYDFTVEIADTYAKRKQGLMNRTSLEADHGMLFVFAKEKPLSFWMKDTPLSLDLIFFDHKGRYVSHHGNAIPNSETSIKSSQPAQFVLEINAGLARQLGIGAGSVFQRKTGQE